jgi:hypothetical protein
MAAETNTLAGLLLLNDANNADINVSDLLEEAPLIAALVAVPASQGGTTHKYMKKTVAAGAGFRDANTGIANAAGKEEQITVTCKYLDGSFHRDVALCDGYKGGRGAYIAKEVRRALKSMFSGAEKQIIQGVGNDANGFIGFAANTAVDKADDVMVYNAGGSGTICRSVYLIRSTEDDVAVVAGNGGNIKFDFDPEQLQKIMTDTSSGAGFMALVASLGGWLGLQFGSVYSLGRICNLDGTTGHTLTDDMIADAISKFPSDKPPTHIVMNRTSLKELRNSRTATSATGAPAPFPAEAFNIPVIVTDSLTSTETALVNA